MNQFALTDPAFSDGEPSPTASTTPIGETPATPTEALSPSLSPEQMVQAVGEGGSAVAADVRAGEKLAEPETQRMQNPLFSFEEDLADAANIPLFKGASPSRAMLGAAIKVGEGVVTLTEAGAQLGLDTAEKLGLIPRGTADDWKFMSEAEKKAVDRQFKADFGGNAGFAAAELTGNVLPFFLLPSKAIPPQVKNLFARVVLGGGLGFAENAAQGLFQPVSGDTIDERNAQRGGAALMAGGIGAAARGGAEVVTSIKNWIPNAIKAAYQEGGQELYERGVQVSQRTGVKYKLSQLLQDPEIENLEKVARGGVKGERVGRAIENQQAVDAKAYFESLLKDQPERFGSTVQDSFFKVLGDEKSGLIGARAANASNNFSQAQAAGAEIYLGNTMKVIDDMIRENTDVLSGRGNVALANELKRLKASILEKSGGKYKQIGVRTNEGGAQTIFEYMAGGGMVTPQSLQNGLTAAGAAAKGNGKIFDETVHQAAERGPAKRLFGALNDDLDAAINEGRKGAAELRIARDQYRVDTGAIEALEETALGKLFGTKAQPTLEDVETAVKNMDPTEIRQTLGILGKTNPAGKERLQQFWLRQAFENARVEGPAGGADFIPAKMLDLRSPGAKNSSYTARETFDAVFPEGDPMRQSVMDGVEAVKYLMVNNNNTGGVTRVKLRQLAYAVANMNVGAGAAFVTDFLTPDFIGKMVMDPDTVRALGELTKPVEVSRQVAAMNVIFNRWINSTSEEERQQ